MKVPGIYTASNLRKKLINFSIKRKNYTLLETKLIILLFAAIQSTSPDYDTLWDR
jgi:hypothetical protein